MAETDELIDHYIDTASTAVDTNTLISQMDQVLAMYEKLNSMKLKLNIDSSWKDVQATTNGIKTATDNLTASAVKYKVTQQQVTQVNQATVVSMTQLDNTIEKNAELLAEQKLRLLEVTAEMKENNAQYQAGAISLERFIEKQAQAIVIQQDLKTSISATTAELKAQSSINFSAPNSSSEAEAQNKLIRISRDNTDFTDVERIAELNALIDRNNDLIDQNSDKLKQRKINIGNYVQSFVTAESILANELENINRQLQQPGLSGAVVDELLKKQQALQSATQIVGQNFSTTAQQQAAFVEAGKQVGQVYGKNSQVFTDYAAQVSAGVKQTKDLGNEVANTAEKAKGFAGALSSVWGAIRQIAYALPGIGIAGLVGLLLDPLITVGAQLLRLDGGLKQLGDTTAETRYQLQQTDEVLDGTDKELTKAIENVYELQEAFRAAREGVISKTEAVKEYNSTMGQTTGVVDTLDQAEQKLADHAQAYIKFTLLKAAAQQALQKAAEQATQAAITAAKPSTDFESLSSLLPNLSGSLGVFPGAGGVDAEQQEKDRQERITRAQKEAQQKQIDQLNAQKAVLLKIATDFYDQAANVAKDNGLFFNKETLQEQQAAIINAINLQIEALKRYEDQQKQIADDDRNTYEKRRAALISYGKTVQDIIQLQKQAELAAEIGNPLAKSLSTSKADTASTQARLQQQNALDALDDSYGKRRINAITQQQEAEIETEKQKNQILYQDETKSLQERIDAYMRFVEDEKQLADLDYIRKLETAGFTPAEIQQLNDGFAVQIQGKRITNEELEALEQAHQQKMEQFAATAGKDIYQITASWAARIEKLAEERNKGVFSGNAQAQYNAQLTALNEQLNKQLISVQQYEAKRGVIEAVGALTRLKATVDDDNEKLADLEGARQKLVDAEISTQKDLLTAIDANNNAEVDTNQKKLQAIYDAEVKNKADIAKVQEKAAQDQVNLTLATTKLLVDAKKAEKAEEMKLEDAAVQLIQNLLDTQYTNKVNEIGAEITAAQTKSQAEIAAEQNSLDSAADKADKIANINAREAQTEAQLNAQINQQKRKQAEVDRIAQIAKITTNAIQAEFDLTAKAAQATAEAALLSANPVTAAYAPIALAAAAAIGTTELIVAGIAAAQIGAILASPLPQYKYGTPKGQSHPGGPALVGDGGRAELMEYADGSLWVTPSKPTLIPDMPAETIVYPDAKKAFREMTYSNFRGSGHVSDSTVSASALLKVQAANQRQETNRIIKAIENKQELHIKPGFNSLIMIQQFGANYKKWVDKALHRRG